MIKHIVMFSFRDDAPEEKVRELLLEYPEFPRIHPQMKSLVIGRNESSRDGRFQYAFVCEFETMSDVEAYLKSDAHEDHVVNRFRPLISERAIVTFEILVELPGSACHALPGKHRGPRTTGFWSAQQTRVKDLSGQAIHADWRRLRDETRGRAFAHH